MKRKAQTEDKLNEMEQDESREFENQEVVENGLFEEIKHVLQFSEKRDGEILQLFGLGSTVAFKNNGQFERCSSNQYYTLEQIKRLSISYRLRFLTVNYYTGEIPCELIFTLKKFEHEHIDSDISYYILAPLSFFFNRDKYSTPLIFGTTDGVRFELICKWGVKTPFYLPILRYPYRNFKSMIISSLLTGCAVAIIISLAGFLNYDSIFKSILMKVPIIILTSGLFSTFALCYGLITRTDFSNENWNERINKIK